MTWVTLLTTWWFIREPGWSMSSARGGQFILSNAESWNIFSAVFILLKPRQASLSSIRRQRRSWIWLRCDESVLETSRRKKYANEAFAKRHLWKKCWTERYANQAELICKTIDTSSDPCETKGQACEVGARSPTELEFLLFERGHEQKNMLAAINRKRPEDYRDRLSKTKGDAT